MTTTEIATIIGVVIVALNFIWTVYWSVRMKRAVDKAQHDETVADHEKRLIEAEARLKQIPSDLASHKDVETLHKRVSDVRDWVQRLDSHLSELTGVVKGIAANLQLLIEHHIEADK